MKIEGGPKTFVSLPKKSRSPDNFVKNVETVKTVQF